MTRRHRHQRGAAQSGPGQRSSTSLMERTNVETVIVAGGDPAQMEKGRLLDDRRAAHCMPAARGSRATMLRGRRHPAGLLVPQQLRRTLVRLKSPPRGRLWCRRGGGERRCHIDPWGYISTAETARCFPGTLASVLTGRIYLDRRCAAAIVAICVGVLASLSERSAPNCRNAVRACGLIISAFLPVRRELANNSGAEGVGGGEHASPEQPQRAKADPHFHAVTSKRPGLSWDYHLGIFSGPAGRRRAEDEFPGSRIEVKAGQRRRAEAERDGLRRAEGEREAAKKRQQDRARSERETDNALVEQTRSRRRPKQWWEVLGVTPNASMTEISVSYREKFGKCHPDSAGRAGSGVYRAGERQIEDLNSAYAQAKARTLVIERVVLFGCRHRR